MKNKEYVVSSCDGAEAFEILAEYVDIENGLIIFSNNKLSSKCDILATFPSDKYYMYKKE